MKKAFVLMICLGWFSGKSVHSIKDDDNDQSKISLQLVAAKENLQALKEQAGLNPNPCQDPKDNTPFLNFLFYYQDDMMTNPEKFLMRLGCDEHKNDGASAVDGRTVKDRLRAILTPIFKDYKTVYPSEEDKGIDTIIDGFLTDDYKKSWGPYKNQDMFDHTIDPFFIYFNNMLIERPVYFFLKLTESANMENQKGINPCYTSPAGDETGLDDDFIHNSETFVYLTTVFYPLALRYLNLNKSDDQETEEKAALIAETFAKIHLCQDYVTLLDMKEGYNHQQDNQPIKTHPEGEDTLGSAFSWTHVIFPKE